MRRIAVVNQKGGVGKTTTCVNLGAALARLGRRVVLVDLDPQANLSLYVGAELEASERTSYAVLTGRASLAEALRETPTAGLGVVPSHIDLSGAELELAATVGRETILCNALADWEAEHRARTGEAPADYVLFDCPPSLGLLSVNALAAARELVVTLQTEFFALQGIAKLLDIVRLVQRRLNPELAVSGILPSLYDSRLKLAREVLAEIRRHFPGQVFRTTVRANVKLAESPSYGQTIFQYAPDSNGARDYLELAHELIGQEGRDPDLAGRARPPAAEPVLRAYVLPSVPPFPLLSAPSAAAVPLGQ